MRRFCNVLYLVTTLAAATSVSAKENLLALQPSSNTNVEVVTLASGAHSSEFLIFIRSAVPNHIHEVHSESIYVLEGTGMMRIAQETVAIAAGDFIHVPKGEVHGVKVTSTSPLKVLSIQAPEFHGADRIWVQD